MKILATVVRKNSALGVIALGGIGIQEVANDGVNVNAIAPGLTDTPMMRGANTPEYIASITQSMPGHRLGQPDDAVGLALCLVSEGAKHVTGKVIALRG